MTRQIKKNPAKSGSGTGGIILAIALVVIILGVLSSQRQDQPEESSETPQTTASASDENSPINEPGLPRLLDLGSLNCVPCKMMEPILEELSEEYEGRFDVEFIDVRQNNAAARQHGIRSIPTQIFFDASGRELYRHIGFYSREDILAKWSELGIVID